MPTLIMRGTVPPFSETRSVACTRKYCDREKIDLEHRLSSCVCMCASVAPERLDDVTCRFLNISNYKT